MLNKLRVRLEHRKKLMRAMSKPRAKALAELKNTSLSLVEHIVKRCICSNTVYHEHWEHEITAMLRRWQRITVKTKNKRLSYSEYIAEVNDWFDEPYDLEVTVKDLIRFKRLQKSEIYPYNKDKAYNSIRKLIEVLMQDVADNTFLEFEDGNYRIPKPEDLI